MLGDPDEDVPIGTDGRSAAAAGTPAIPFRAAELPAALVARLHRCFREQSPKPATARALLADGRLFARWCRQHAARRCRRPPRPPTPSWRPRAAGLANPCDGWQVNHTVRSPRWRNAASYSAQFVTRRFGRGI